MSLLHLAIAFLLSIVVRIEGQQAMTCGQRFTEHPPLMTQNWPWHAAIYHRRLNDSVPEYKCGGTVITARFVLTAGQCVQVETNRVSVSLGRLRLNLNESWAQSFEVAKIDVHPNYNPIDLRNDIAIIRLATDATFNNHVRPICLWNATRTDLSEVIGRDGTVIGFGLTENFTLSMELREAVMPVINLTTCLRPEMDFSGEYLSETNFCAGTRPSKPPRNVSLLGTSVCTGDSGGSMSFQENGSYYIRGIISVAPAIADETADEPRCDSTHYAVCTDVAKYLQWIEERMACVKMVFGWCNDDNGKRSPGCEFFVDAKLSERKCKIRFSASANAAVTWLRIEGDLEALPDLSDAVTKFENLNYLSFLSYPRLKIVERENFAAFGRLGKLFLGCNSITAIAAHTFDDLTNLTDLYLCYNQLVEIHADSFAELGELILVDLSQNELEVIPYGLFRNNLRLKSILLQNNKIKEIHRDLFNGLGRLTDLYLNANEIEILPEDLFRDNRRLQSIWLHNNKIERIETNFQHLVDLLELDLRGNVCIDEYCGYYNSFCGTNSTSAMQTMVRTKCP